MPAQATNTDLSLGYVRPGVYVQLNLNSPGGGLNDNFRLLLMAYKSSGGSAAPDQPIFPASQSDANSLLGQGSDAARMYAAAVSQPEAQGAEIWVCPITAPSAGTASIYSVVFSGTATAAGAIDCWIASDKVATVAVANGDTAATVAENWEALVDDMLDLPITSGVSSATVTLTYRHKGLVGEDLPLRFQVTGAAGIKISPGALTFTTQAVGDGSVSVKSGATTVTAAISNNDTAVQVATKVTTAINAGSYPFTATQRANPNDHIVDLFFANERDVRRVSAWVTTTTGTTVNAGSGATDGSGSASSISYMTSAVGAGAPSLTAALSNISALDAFNCWAVPFTDVATLGALSTHIENAADGSPTGQKGQTLHVCSFEGVATAGAIPTGTTPALTASPRYALLWAQDVPVQGYEVAARVAAARAANSNPAKNWNGFRLKTNDRTGLLLTAIASRPSGSTINTAIKTYGLAPVVVSQSAGALVIDKGRTTSMSTYRPLWSWSCIDQADYWRDSIRGDFQDVFAGTSVLRYSEPKSPGLIDANSVKSRTVFLMHQWEGLGFYDGADALADAVKASVNQSNPNRIDLSFPMSPVLDADQFAVVGNFQTPGA